MRYYPPFRFDTGGRNYDDPVLGPIACEKWVGTFMMNKYIGSYIDSHFSDVDCIGTQWRWNENENEFTEYRDSVIHIGLKKFDCNITYLPLSMQQTRYKFYEKIEASEETRVNRIMAKKVDPLFSWSMATEPGNVTPYIAATAIRQRRHPPETTSDIGAATTTGGRRHYSRKNKKKRQKKRRNTKSKKYRK